MISPVEMIGYLAAVLTTVAFIPQAVLVYKTKDTRSISLAMFLIFNLGLICWALYGIFLKQLPLILANVTTLIFALYILYMKVTEKRRKFF
ncbi:MAG TPA: SemiSWEET transporter [Cytophagaceae bacterium]|jgi:MtN3 and saliva related transmembrane protein|nr:SemiSWEET transporter [Cytophagaceae bacterium]